MQPGRVPADAPAGLIQRDAGLGPDHRFAVLIGGLTPRREARERLAQAPRRQGQAKPALPHRDRLPVGEPELLVQDRREGQGLGADLRGRLRRLAGMPALDSGAARDTVADVDPKPRHVDAPDDTLPGLGPRPARARSPRDTSGRPPAAAHRPRCPPAPGPSGAASARTWARLLPAGSLRGRLRLALGDGAAWRFRARCAVASSGLSRSRSCLSRSQLLAACSGLCSRRATSASFCLMSRRSLLTSVFRSLTRCPTVRPNTRIHATIAEATGFVQSPLTESLFLRLRTR